MGTGVGEGATAGVGLVTVVVTTGMLSRLPVTFTNRRSIQPVSPPQSTSSHALVTRRGP